MFFRKPDYWLIFDELQGTGLHQVESYLHFAPSNLEPGPDRVVATFPSGRELTVTLAGAPLKMSLCATHQSHRPDSGWIGVGYGCRRPAPVVRWHADLVLPQRWCMLVTCEGRDWQLNCRQDGVVVQGHGRIDRFGWPGDEPTSDGGDMGSNRVAMDSFCFQLDGCDRTEICGSGGEG